MVSLTGPATVPPEYTWRAGRIYYPRGHGSTATTTVHNDATAGTCRVSPVYIPHACTAALAITLSSTGSTDGLYEFCAYTEDDGRPGTLIATGGTASTNATGAVVAPVPIALPRGWVWVGGLWTGTSEPGFRCLGDRDYELAVGTSSYTASTLRSAAYDDVTLQATPAWTLGAYDAIRIGLSIVSVP